MSACAEITYMKPDVGPVHSDLCPPGHDLSRGVSDPEWRAMLHRNLDEWIDKSESTGYFFIGNGENYFVYDGRGR